MALPTASDNEFPKVILEEVAADGSATVTPAADHRALFLGEDGALHLKDSAAAVTDVGGSETLPESILDAAGDLITADGADSAVRLARGTDGQVFKSTSSTVAWENDLAPFQVILDGGGDPVSTGAKGFFRIPYACVITEAYLLAEQATSAVVDLWMDSMANHPPTDADSITSATPLTLTAADSVVDTTLSSWTTTVAAGAVIRVNVDSNDVGELLTVGITVRKT